MPFNNVTSSDIFKCMQCGECCKGYGGTYVSDADIRAIADYINKSPEVVRAGYCQLSGKKLLIRQKEDGFCIFFDKLCTIHPVKPRMCRAWPYIKSVVADVNNWHIMSSMCPGIQTHFPDDVIVRCVSEEIDKLDNKRK
ncbi:MAG: YkgJ family cysteine cluster protein [Desulfobacterales bacterium]|nr:YkgJ family cysteine cluster protein [Desulfobacterales bacterium]